MSPRHPHHVVLTFRPGVPNPTWRGVHRLLLGLIRDVQERFGASVSLACSMWDHIHLLVETPPGSSSLGDVMRYFKSKLALDINRRFRRRGPVHRDRYFSRPLKSLSELVGVIRYVAMNPVKAGLVSEASRYEFSSVGDYLHRYLPASPWRTRGWMYKHLGFLDDPRAALMRILDGTTRPVHHTGARQLRLPFEKGLPEHRVQVTRRRR